MKPILWILIVILAVFLLCLTVVAQASQPNPPSSAATEIKALEGQLEDLLLKGEWQEYASHLAPDFWQVGEELRDKKDLLSDLQSGKIKFLYLTPDDEQVRSYDDTAILNLHLSITTRENGKVITTAHRMTKVFVRQNGRWALVSLTDVPVSH